MSSYDKTLREGLQILLYHVDPAGILDNWQNCLPTQQYQTIPKQFPHLLVHIHPEQFSIDDAKNVGKILQHRFEGADRFGVFSLISDFALQTLIQRGLHPFVRYDQILRWRHATQRLGTLPFMCAFLASQDALLGYARQSFCLNPILQSDNKRLQIILAKGMAENHFHLKGSSRSALLSWVCLMNDVTDRSKPFHMMEELQLGENAESLGRPLQVLVLQAAAIRAFLFLLLEGSQQDRDEQMLCQILRCEQLIDCEAHINALQNWLSNLQATFGIDIEHTRPDYAICRLHDVMEEKPFLLLSGEYRFQYCMFQAIFRQEPKFLPYLDLFYAYLVISIRFRGELIQCNSHVGFQNFSEYDSRKGDFLKRRHVFETAYEVGAATAVLQDPRIRFLEIRIVPKQDTKALSRQIKRTNQQIKEFFPDEETASKMLAKLCYVLHIPKRHDDPPQNQPSEYVCCRDKRLREHVSKVADALIQLRDSNDSAAYWIQGIDACANEADSRPEVFAAAYRRLKGHQSRYLPGPSLIADKTMPMLHVTYHVGEDFLDLADGLRAIWEAIKFLELDRLDRIGHGLALGITPREWYASKQHRVYLTRQALLDNCAWMLHILASYGALEPQLAKELENECAIQYAAIYQSNLPYQECEANFEVFTYFLSMELRGDDPICYLDYLDAETFTKKLESYKGQDPYRLRDDEKGRSCYTARRHNIQAVRLYHHYHFNPNVKLLGSEVVEFQVSSYYVDAVERLQKIMQKQIAGLGIGIETNPSSNVLISNFKRYDKHPLITFNDSGLFDRPDNPNLFISINTDDQGVFDTCLENEYALMARSLEQRTDEQGFPVVSSDHIYRWLDHIRQMGLEQSFFN